MRFLLILLLIRENLAKGNYEYQNIRSTQRNFESSYYENSPEYHTEAMGYSKWDLRNNKNSHISSHDDITSRNERDFGYVSQSSHFKNDWASEIAQSSQGSTSRLYFESSTSSSKIENRLKNSKTSLSRNKQSKKIKEFSSNSTSNYFQKIRTTRTTPTSVFKSYTSLREKSPKTTTRTSKTTAKSPNKYKLPSSSNYKRISERKYEKYLQKIFGDNDDSELDEGLTFRSANFDGREVAEPGEYPHMTAIGYRRLDNSMDWKCGGSLIDEYFVITAAHCTDFSGQKPSEVKIGDINLKVHEQSVEPQTISIQNIYNHPKYDKSSYYNDIALLRLKTGVIFTKFVQPIRLYTKNNIPYDTVFAMGYGSTAFGKAKTNILTDLNLTIVQNDECNQILPKEPEASKGIVTSQICAVDKEGNRDTCQGDSGGPLQLNLLGSKRTQYHLIGITSYGLFCGTQKPSVYTRISSFIDWIEKTVWTDDL